MEPLLAADGTWGASVEKEMLVGSIGREKHHFLKISLSLAMVIGIKLKNYGLNCYMPWLRGWKTLGGRQYQTNRPTMHLQYHQLHHRCRFQAAVLLHPQSKPGITERFLSRFSSSFDRKYAAASEMSQWN